MRSDIITILEITQKDEERWNNLLLNSINPSYRQTIKYEYVRKNYGRDINTFIFSVNGSDVAGAHYSLKRINSKYFIIADILSGFVFKEEPNSEFLSFVLEHYLSWAKNNNVSFARFTPWIPIMIAGKEQDFAKQFSNELDRKGFHIMESARHTYWIDLSQSDEMLLANMKRQTRYEIRQGVKSLIEIKKFENPDDKNFELFWSFYSNLGKQKEFDILPKERFKQEVHGLMEAGFAELFIAYYNDQAINVSLASNFGQAAYLYGAMNPELKRIKDCPSPGQLAQWEMIKVMKSKGLKVYDMGFCPGAIPETNHPQFYIWRFKQGFGGDHVEFLPTFGKILKPLRGKLFQFIKYRK